LSLIYKLDPPVTLGDLTNSITVSALKLSSISVNFEPAYSSSGVAVLSVCLVCPDSGYRVNVVYQDADALDIARNLEGKLELDLFGQMINTGRLPCGHLFEEAEPPAAN
jgi:hypothetical protein